jgi:hypothetical protein
LPNVTKNMYKIYQKGQQRLRTHHNKWRMFGAGMYTLLATSWYGCFSFCLLVWKPLSVARAPISAHIGPKCGPNPQ